MSDESPKQPKPVDMFAIAAGRSIEHIVRCMLNSIPVVPESGREIFEVLEPLGCTDEMLSKIAKLDDPDIHPAIRMMIFHRFTEQVKETRKLPAHRPGGRRAALRQLVAVCETSGDMSRDAAVAYVAQALNLPMSEIRSAVRDRPGRRKKAKGVGN